MIYNYSFTHSKIPPPSTWIALSQMHPSLLSLPNSNSLTPYAARRIAYLWLWLSSPCWRLCGIMCSTMIWNRPRSRSDLRDNDVRCCREIGCSWLRKLFVDVIGGKFHWVLGSLLAFGFWFLLGCYRLTCSYLSVRSSFDLVGMDWEELIARRLSTCELRHLVCLQICWRQSHFECLGFS